MKSNRDVILKIGKSENVFSTMKDAVDFHNMLRESSNAGASEWPKCSLQFGANKYRVSYNGRVWDKNDQEVAI